MNKGRKFIFIVNPAAGRAKAKKRLPALLGELSRLGCRSECHYTEYPNHAFELASAYAAEQDGILVSYGGDGTFNEVASARIGKPGCIALVPAGSGNGLARSLHIMKHGHSMTACLCNGKERSIDAGKFRKNYFFCTCGIGFDASVAARFNANSRRGIAGYVMTVVQTFFTYRPVEAVLDIDGKIFAGHYFLVTVANAPQYGNDAYIAPHASLSDGWLEVTLVRPFPGIFVPLLVLSLFFRFIDHLPWVKVLKAQKVVIVRCSSPHFHYDGESSVMEWPLETEVVPGAVTLLTCPGKVKPGILRMFRTFITPKR